MKEKNNKKIIIIATLFMLLISVFFTIDTYAKYITATNEKTTMKIARWRILVNNKNIQDNDTAETSIVPVFPGNENIAPDIIAPTSKGYFDLIIDANETDVSFTYKINVAVNEQSVVKDLIATSYQINGGEEIPLDKSNQTIEGNILYNDTTRQSTVRVYIMWDDSDTATMDNIGDTNTTIDPNSKAIMDVNMSFIQLANSEITPPSPDPNPTPGPEPNPNPDPIVPPVQP